MMTNEQLTEAVLWLLERAYREELEVIDGYKMHPDGLTIGDYIAKIINKRTIDKS